MNDALPTLKLDTPTLEILEAYKKRFSPEGSSTNDSPFDDHDVIRYDDSVESFDVPAIHNDARRRIEAIIRGIHSGKPSQVVLLAGNPGSGKTHLINSFKSFEKSQDLGYVFVRSSNHWDLDDFEKCLLDWTINALCAPSVDGRHLLLDKIEDIAFQALSMILEKPGAIDGYKAHTVRFFLSKIWARLSGSDHERFRRAVDRHDVKIFRRLRFASFADYVCGQFLFDSNNVFHRFVVHVLMRYLFVEDRDKVRCWLRGNAVGDFFLKKLGIFEEIDRRDKQFELLKILVSLFTPHVSSKLLGRDGDPSRDLVYFFAFDQSETRNAMFDTPDQWRQFFAKLSELYNALPNVLIVFTMTLGLRDEHLANMEGQFKERIHQDPVFLLKDISASEILALYRSRVKSWLGSDAEAMQQKLDAIHNPYLPLSQTEVLDSAQKATLRQMVRNFDARFRERILRIPTVVPSDFRTFLNELRHDDTRQSEHAFVENHIQTLEEVWVQMGEALVKDDGIVYQGYEFFKSPQHSLPAIRLQFADAEMPNLWFRVFVTRVGYVFKERLNDCRDLLRNLEKAKYHLWIVRAGQIDDSSLKAKSTNVFVQAIQTEEEAILQSALEVWHRRDKYTRDAWNKGLPFLLAQIRSTYVGKLLAETRQAITALRSDTTATEPLTEKTSDIASS